MPNFLVGVQYLDDYDLYTKIKILDRSWPVSEAYWFLAGEVHPLDQLVGKVLM
jgi:hypothetical protein